jgi:hypothetical protein
MESQLTRNQFLMATILLLIGAQPTVAVTPEVIGPGCTTAFFIDKECKGVGVGVKSSGIYPPNLTETLGQPGTWTVGDRSDPDPTDPTVKTTAEWQTKWGANNDGMVKFLQQRKQFTNTARIFYVSQTGDDATGSTNDPAKPFRTMAPIMTKLMDLQGGAIIVRGGVWTDLDFNACQYSHKNPCFNLSGSQGHGIYLMAYPGESVQTDIPITATLTYRPAPNVCCVTVDGLEFRDDKYGLGDGFSLTNTSDYSFVNDEFAAWHQAFFGDHTVNATVKDSVFHDMMYHAVYWGDSVPLGGPGDFDFVTNHKNCINGSLTKMCASSNAQIVDNVMYSNGTSGYEPIHLNTYLDGAIVEGNIVSYSGGTAVALETGVYHADIKSNLFFDNGRACITLYLYDNGLATQAATLRWNTIENNICYVGNQTDIIRETNPAGGIAQLDSTKTPGHYIENTVIRNNIIVTYNRSPYWSGIPFSFERNSHPETDTIENNVVWSTAPGAGPEDRIISISRDASATGLASGTYNLKQLQALDKNFHGNAYADPKFKSASNRLIATPGAFNFASPATVAVHAGLLKKELDHQQ